MIPKKKVKLEDFWIKVMTRDLSTCFPGEGSWNQKKDIHYVCSQHSDDEFDISQIIYKIIKLYKELEKSDNDYELIVTAHHSDDFDFADDGETVREVRNKENTSNSCV